MMSDKKPDLTPFIEAAKRGCTWFSVNSTGVVFFFNGVYFEDIPCIAKGRSYIAACVCIEWWQEWWANETKTTKGSKLFLQDLTFYEKMIYKLRAFKREYGAE
jgi:hypothetical protein